MYLHVYLTLPFCPIPLYLDTHVWMCTTPSLANQSLHVIPCWKGSVDGYLSSKLHRLELSRLGVVNQEFKVVISALRVKVSSRAVKGEMSPSCLWLSKSSEVKWVGKLTSRASMSSSFIPIHQMSKDW